MYKNKQIYMLVIQQTISTEMAGKLASDSKKKGITIQALIRNIISDYYEQKELPNKN